MKITNLSYTERKTLAQYEFAELTAHAVVEENDDVNSALLTLKTFVHNSINGKITQIKEDNGKAGRNMEERNTDITNDDGESKKLEIKEESSADKKTTESPKAKRGPKPKATQVEDSFNGQDIPPVIPAEAKPAKSKDIAYDRSIESHKNTLSIHLSGKFPGWKSSKPREEIIAFTASLEGKPFLNEGGEVIESFHNILRSFFNA